MSNPPRRQTPAQERARTMRLPSVSYSELATRARCPRQHYWTYRHEGHGIERVKEFNAASTLGRIGHSALAALYSGHPVSVGIDLALQQIMESGSLFEEQEAELDDVAQTVGDVLARYREQYPVEEFRVLAVEREFNIRLPGLGRRFTGFWDALVQDQNEGVWIMDHKWVTGQFRKEHELELDLQIGNYEWAALTCGIPLSGTIYNQLWAERPEPPRVLESGKLSQDKRQKTTWPLYKAALEERGLDPRNYAEMQIALMERSWFDRHYIQRTPDMIQRYADDVFARVKELRRPKAPAYMTPSRMVCNMCAFRDLCLEEVRGRDVTPLLEGLYQPRQKGQPLSFPMLGDGT